MSLLRPSPIASRLLQKGRSPAVARRFGPSVAARAYSTTKVGTPLTTSDTQKTSDSKSTSMVPAEEQENKTGIYTQPDYSAEVDQASSTYSPVPRRLMNGSEDTDVLPAAVLSGAPNELQARTVRIYRPAKTATQSGDWAAHHWRLDWDVLAKGHRWENPLMGWQSTGDFMQGTHLNFRSREDAVRFAEKQGYEYFVQEPQDRRVRVKAYADNFVYSNRKLKHVRTK